MAVYENEMYASIVLIEHAYIWTCKSTSVYKLVDDSDILLEATSFSACSG